MIPQISEDNNLCMELRRIFYNFKLSQQQARKFSSLMVTSAQAGEGKTILSLAFALGLAKENNAKTLLVDANWIAPTLHHWFGLERTVSFDKFWSDPLESIQASCIENLDILVAPQNVEVDSADEFVKSDILRNVFEQLTKEYQTVIFDTSAILQNLNKYGSEPGLRNFDSLVLSDFVKTSILTILARKTNKQMVKKARFTLDKGSHEILAVLNNFKNPFYS